MENSNKTITALKNGKIVPQNSFNLMDNILFNGLLLSQSDDCQNLGLTRNAVDKIKEFSFA